MPRSGFNGVDFEDNINFERLHSERLERAKKFLHESEFGALLCYDFDNIRYITGTHVGEWNRNKMNRHCLLIDGYISRFCLIRPARPRDSVFHGFVRKTSCLQLVL